MEKVFSHGKMVVSMKENIMMIRKKVLESFGGQMVRPTMASGKMANSMVSEHTLQRRESDMEYGTMGRNRNGLKELIFLLNILKEKLS